jgi:predicted DNA-binding transcriptional regulator YafY
MEVSERTIYRDIDALSSAGVPIYGEPGPAGGYALLDSYRTTLTGLTDGELRALFMLSIPDALADLGLSQPLRSVLLKLSAALPVARRGEQDLVRQRFFLDSAWWRQGEEPVPHLLMLQQAVWQDRRVWLAYRSLEAARERILSFGNGVEVVEPLALRWSVQDLAVQILAVYGRPDQP